MQTGPLWRRRAAAAWGRRAEAALTGTPACCVGPSSHERHLRGWPRWAAETSAHWCWLTAWAASAACRRRAAPETCGAAAAGRCRLPLPCPDSRRWSARPASRRQPRLAAKRLLGGRQAAGVPGRIERGSAGSGHPGAGVGAAVAASVAETPVGTPADCGTAWSHRPPPEALRGAAPHPAGCEAAGSGYTDVESTAAAAAALRAASRGAAAATAAHTVRTGGGTRGSYHVSRSPTTAPTATATAPTVSPPLRL